MTAFHLCRKSSFSGGKSKGTGLSAKKVFEKKSISVVLIFSKSIGESVSHLLQSSSTMLLHEFPPKQGICHALVAIIKHGLLKSKMTLELISSMEYKCTFRTKYPKHRFKFLLANIAAIENSETRKNRPMVLYF